jgi:hypothetical protein
MQCKNVQNYSQIILKRGETNIVSIIINGVPWQVYAILLPFLTIRSTQFMYQKIAMYILERGQMKQNFLCHTVIAQHKLLSKVKFWHLVKDQMMWCQLLSYLLSTFLWTFQFKIRHRLFKLKLMKWCIGRHKKHPLFKGIFSIFEQVIRGGSMICG